MYHKLWINELQVGTKFSIIENKANYENLIETWLRIQNKCPYGGTCVKSHSEVEDKCSGTRKYALKVI